MAGADRFFNYSKVKKLDENNIKFVTHHWSSNFNKGFDLYQTI